MPQPCHACLWISSDEAEECERCGESFSGRRAPVLPAGAISTAVKTIVAVFALGIAAAIAARRLGSRFPDVWEAVKTGAQAFYAWLLGPNEFFKPYLFIMLGVTALVWVVLWLLARINNS